MFLVTHDVSNSVPGASEWFLKAFRCLGVLPEGVPDAAGWFLNAFLVPRAGS